MIRVSVSKIKADFSEYVNRATYGRERVIIMSRGKPKAVIMSLEDLEALETAAQTTPMLKTGEEVATITIDTNQTTRQFTAITWQEGKWFVAQCLQVEVTSQGRTETEALVNLREALELHFEPPRATILPQTHSLEVTLRAAA